MLVKYNMLANIWLIIGVYSVVRMPIGNVVRWMTFPFLGLLVLTLACDPAAQSAPRGETVAQPPAVHQSEPTPGLDAVRQPTAIHRSELTPGEVPLAQPAPRQSTPTPRGDATLQPASREAEPTPTEAALAQIASQDSEPMPEATMVVQQSEPTPTPTPEVVCVSGPSGRKCFPRSQPTPTPKYPELGPLNKYAVAAEAARARNAAGDSQVEVPAVFIFISLSSKYPSRPRLAARERSSQDCRSQRELA